MSQVDLSFPRFDKQAALTVLPPDLAVMMVGIAARQATSPTALLGGRIARNPVEDCLLSPAHGAFNAGVAAALSAWKQE